MVLAKVKAVKVQPLVNREGAIRMERTRAQHIELNQPPRSSMTIYSVVAGIDGWKSQVQSVGSNHLLQNRARVDAL